MFVFQLLLGILLVSLPTLSRCEDESVGSKETPIDPQDTFSKKLGENIPDQIAIESNHEHVEHRGEGGIQQRPIPIPVPVQTFPGSMVLPIPPGFGPNAMPGQHINMHLKHPGHGPFSIPTPHFQPPHPLQGNNPDFRIAKGKEVFGSGPNLITPSQIPIGQSSTQLHQSHNNAHQQIHNQLKQQVQQQFIKSITNSGESLHPNHKQNSQQLPGLTEPKVMNSPIRGDQPPSNNFPPHNQDAQLANSVFREMFEKQRQKQKIQSNGFRHPDLKHPNFGGNFNRPGPSQIRPIKEVSNDLQAEGGQFPGPVSQYGGQGQLGQNPTAAAGTWPTADIDMPKIVSLEVKCEKNVMRVYIAFDKPFHGVIFSKGHYHNINCIHLPAGLGHTSANFDISIDSCGTQGNTENGLYGYGVQAGSGSYFENIIVIQYDPQVQEVWDQARKLRCTWHDQYEKSVTFRPFPVDMLDVVRADFAGDNVGCWMQIQVGKGPWASEVSGLVKIGQTMTMVLAIKDDDNKFDMLARNCMAHDGVRAPIQLVDQWGCVTRPKLMSRFTKIKNFGASASVLSYAHFQAFKFPDSMEVHFQCTIQICRYQCPDQCTQPNDGQGAIGGGGGYGVGKSGFPSEREEAAARRKRRSVSGENLSSSSSDIFEYTTTFTANLQSNDDEREDVGLDRSITVVTNEDMDFFGKTDEGIPVIEATEYVGDVVCMSTFGFASMLIVLIGTLLIACIVSAVILLKKPRKH